MTRPTKTQPSALAKLICLAVAFCAVAARAVVSAPGEGPVVSSLGHLPLCFEASGGQSDNGFQFFARGRGCNFFVAPTEALLTLTRIDAAPDSNRDERAVAGSSGLAVTHQLRFEFVGANRAARLSGAGVLGGKANYFLGRDPAQWRAGIPLFGQVRVGQIYPGVDLVYYGNERRLEYDFVVAPKAAPENISIHFTGADLIRVNSEGELVFSLGRAEIRQPQPVIYQLVRGARKEIAGGYHLIDRQTVRFQIGEYDRELPLVIDPVLSYSTFFGKSGSDIIWDVAVDKGGPNGFVYVAGESMSANLPVTTTNAYRGGSQFGGDAFVAKFDHTGTALSYLTYIGGKGDDAALGIAVDPDGNAYITGFTTSTNFPTPNGIYTNLGGGVVSGFGNYPQDAFVAKLNSSGTLDYATYLGGSTNDVGIGIALDAARNVYVTGYTGSTNFPTTNALQSLRLGAENAFVTAINATGSALLYSTYLGGSNVDHGESIAVEDDGHAYVTGYTSSTNFPTANAFQSVLNRGRTNFLSGSRDVFLTKLNPSGGGPEFSTFFGGAQSDVGFRVTLDAQANVFLTGTTTSTNFLRTSTNLHSSLASGSLLADAFVAKFTSTGSNVYSVVFGGNNLDEAWDVAVDAAGNAHVVGETYSTNFPTFGASGFLRATNVGGSDVFVSVINSNGTEFVRSTLIGGTKNDFGYAIETDPAGNDIIVGKTASANFPTVAAYQSAFGGTNDGFIAKLTVEPPLDVVLTLLKTDAGDVSLSWPITIWPAFGPDFVLESNSSLLSASGWLTVTAPDFQAAGQHEVTLGATNEFLRFRLKR